MVPLCLLAALVTGAGFPRQLPEGERVAIETYRGVGARDAVHVVVVASGRWELTELVEGRKRRMLHGTLSAGALAQARQLAEAVCAHAEQNGWLDPAANGYPPALDEVRSWTFGCHDEHLATDPSAPAFQKFFTTLGTLLDASTGR
ncbi:MAG TPA: hypothetical protein VMB50_23350 [Myxococcales bacterium]|nr:hypothetical protein [Myxococcales bacterium]